MALRAPKAILQSHFDHRLDIRSFACYLFEVFTKQPLFGLPPFYPAQLDSNHLHQMCDENGLLQQDDNDHFFSTSRDGQSLEMKDDDHLLQVFTTLGPLPLATYEKWPRRVRYFDADFKLIRTDVGKSKTPLFDVHIVDTLEQGFRKSRPPDMTTEEADDLVHV